MSVSWRAAAAALGAGTAVLVLAVVSLGVLFETLALLAAFAASDPAPLLSSPQWTAVRLLACAGSGGVCALILSRLSDGSAGSEGS